MCLSRFHFFTVWYCLTFDSQRLSNHLLASLAFVHWEREMWDRVWWRRVKVKSCDAGQAFGRVCVLGHATGLFFFDIIPPLWRTGAATGASAQCFTHFAISHSRCVANFVVDVTRLMESHERGADESRRPTWFDSARQQQSTLLSSWEENMWGTTSKPVTPTTDIELLRHSKLGKTQSIHTNKKNSVPLHQNTMTICGEKKANTNNSGSIPITNQNNERNDIKWWWTEHSVNWPVERLLPTREATTILSMLLQQQQQTLHQKWKFSPRWHPPLSIIIKHHHHHHHHNKFLESNNSNNIVISALTTFTGALSYRSTWPISVKVSRRWRLFRGILRRVIKSMNLTW